jgi:cbb3-type cytochrome oxidase maturation protein
MSIILILIAASLSIALIFLLIFIWCVRSGQYDDAVAPALRILFDEPTHQSRPDQTDDSSIRQGSDASDEDSSATPSGDSALLSADFNDRSKTSTRENKSHV